jgi:hypothetical protein
VIAPEAIQDAGTCKSWQALPLMPEQKTNAGFFKENMCSWLI